MRRRAFLSSSVGLLAGCASGAALHAGPSNLAAREGGPRPGEAEKWPAGIPKTVEESHHQAVGLAQVGSGPFVRGPERPCRTPPGHSRRSWAIEPKSGNRGIAVPSRHRLRVRPGRVAFVSERGLRIGRAKSGRSGVWCAEDEVSAAPELAKTLADAPELILARRSRVATARQSPLLGIECRTRAALMKPSAAENPIGAVATGAGWGPVPPEFHRHRSGRRWLVSVRLLFSDGSWLPPTVGGMAGRAR